MTEQLRQGRAVSWAGPRLPVAGGDPGERAGYPWGRVDLARTATDGRHFHIHLRDTDAPIVSLPTSATRFAAGRWVFEAFASEAAGQPPRPWPSAGRRESPQVARRFTESCTSRKLGRFDRQKEHFASKYD